MTYILPYAIQEGNLIYLLKSGSDVQSVKPSMPQHVRSHLEVHRINQLTFMKKGSDIEAQLHVRTHLFHKLFLGVASPGVFRATHFLMVKVIHNDRVPRLCSSVGPVSYTHLDVYKRQNRNCSILRFCFADIRNSLPKERLMISILIISRC